MAWFNQDFCHESDLLSVALGESGLNLSEQDPFTAFDRNETGTCTGGSLSLESTSTPNELLNWTLYLTNPSNQTPPDGQDDFSRYLEPFGDFKSSYSHDTDAKPSFHSRDPTTNATTSLDVYAGANSNDLYSQSGTNETLPNKNSERLIDLLTFNNEHSANITPKDATKPTINGIKTELHILQRKDVSRLWANDDLKLNDVTEANQKVKDEVEEDDDEEEGDLGYSDTYAEYMPSKLRIGKRHPDSVVETSSLSSVAPPDVWYQLKIPNEIVEKHLLSALQLEAIVYACQRQETLLGDGSRAGFLIGDGAGVGKGRTVAGIIYENYLLGRKRALWLSVSNDLQYDAIRDLRDIKCNVSVRSLNKFKYDSKISSKENGGFKKGVLFSTYSSLIGESQGTTKYRTRLNQILKWCGSDFDGVIILDECHKAKNLVPSGSSKPTKTGKTVLELQSSLPKARVVYCSATGASEPKNMAYMSRLGIWGKGTPFKEFSDFIQAVERRGVGAMELVAMDMKLRGMYMARQLSFSGVTFDIKEVPLSDEFIEMYNASAILWQQAREKFEKSIELTDSDGRMRKTLWGQFWAAHQRFFKYLCIASKVKAAVAIAKESTEYGKCVVIGLQSTGEARTLEQLGEAGELTEFVSTAKGVFQGLIEKHFPVPDFKRSCDLYDDSEVPKQSTTGQKKRKAHFGKKKEKRFKKEDLFGHSGLSGDEMNSNEDEMSSTYHNSDTSPHSTPQRMDSDGEEDDEDELSDSDSDDDNWLKQLKEKPKKKAKVKSHQNGPLFQDETSMDALAAAGLNVSTLSWNKPTQKASTAVIATPKAESSGSSTSFDSILSKLALKPKCNGDIPSVNGLVDFIKSSSITADQFTTLTSSEQCQVMKSELLNKLDFLGCYLPNNTLDQLLDDLGGPGHVAEMTGRKGRVVSSKDGSVTYESRSERDVPLELLNIAEKKRFMQGEKEIAIISEAASSGISLQADRREKNQKRRVHITLELPWSADKAIQQFGRTHRSNQVSAPEYLFLISKLSGEQRFASIVAKRLESLGALTHGDRRATESRDLSKYNFDNKYGRSALEVVLKSIVGQATALTEPPAGYSGDFFSDVRSALIGVGVIIKGEKSGIEILDKDYCNISKFLNRLLGVEVELQNALFQYFTTTLATVIQQAKRSRKYDEGILDLGSQGEDVHRLDITTFQNTNSSDCGATELHTVNVERGMSWKKAVATLQDNELPHEGFYLSHTLRNNKRTACLVKSVMSSSMQKKQTYHVYRPNIGLLQKEQSLQEINKTHKRVAVGDAKAAWIDQYNFSESQCSHSYWKGNCKKKSLGLTCSVGLRKQTYHILSGSVLRVWNQVEGILATQGGSNSRMQIIRVRTVDGLRIVGSLIPSNCVEALKQSLTAADQQPVPGDPGFPLEIL